MRQLDSLIRLHEWQLDEKRRALADTQRMADQLRGDLARLEAEVAEERALAAGSYEAGLTYGAYARATIQRREKLEASIAEVDRRVEAATDEVAAAWRELRKFEITKEIRAKRQREAEARVEQVALDEVGLNLHRRREG